MNNLQRRSGDPWLPHAKFARPNLPSSFRRRTRLLERLRDSQSTPVTVVRGLPGSGKSMAVSDWVGLESGDATPYTSRFAWVSCDDGDRDPRRLWSSVVSGIEQAVGKAVTTSNGSEVAAVVNDLLAEMPSFVIVIDDIDRAVDPSPVLGPLLERLPAGTTVVCTTRRRLHFGRLDAVGLVADIRPPALQFTPDDIAAFLAFHGVELDEDVVTNLHDATEGWIAPINLVLSATQGDDTARWTQLERLADPDDVTASLPPVVRRFLADEIRRAGGSEVLESLFALADLRQFTVSDCSAVLGAHGADEFERLESGGMFIVEADDGESYRFHGLFQRYLGHEAIGRPQRLRIERHRTAARWFESVGSTGRAIRHHIAAGAVTDAIEVLANTLLGGSSIVDPLSVAAWLAEIDEDLLRERRSPHAFSVYALALIHGGDPARARRWLLAAEQVGTHDSDPRAALIAQLGIAAMEGRVEDAIASHDKLRAVGQQMQEPLGVVESMCGIISRTWGDDMIEAHATFDEFIESSPPPAHKTMAASAYSYVLVGEGRLNDAASVAERAIESACEQGIECHWAMTGAWYTRAQVAYERGDLDAAGNALSGWMDKCTPLPPAANFQVHIQLANTMATAGHLSDARMVASSAAELPLAHGSPLWDQLTVLDVRIALVSGEFGRAGWVVPRITSSRLRTVMEARVALAAGDVSAAEDLAPRLAAPDRLPTRLDHRIVQARLAHLLGDERAGLEHLARATDLAVPEMAVMPFVEDGPDLLNLLSDGLADRPHGDFVASAEQVNQVVRTASRHQDLSTASPTDRERIAKLPLRERQVLRLIGEQLANREIATTMGISMNTLKTHIRKLYRHLGVTDRARAASVARRSLGSDVTDRSRRARPM